MPSARNTTTIRRPVHEVFAFVADGETAPRWRPAVVDISRVSGSGVGTTYRQGVKGPGGRRIAADYEVTAFEPDRRIAFRAIAGPVRPSGEYVFEPDAAGTRLTFSLQADLAAWQRLFMGGSVQRSMDAEVASIERIEGAMPPAASEPAGG